MASPLPPPPDLLDKAALFLDFDGTLVELADTPDSDPRARGPGADCSSGCAAGSAAGSRSSAAARSPISSGICRCTASPFRARTGSSCGSPTAPGCRSACRSGSTTSTPGSRPSPPRTPGLIVEEKPAGIALHYRLAPRRGRARRRVHGGARQGARLPGAARRDGGRAAPDRRDQGRRAEGVHDGTGVHRRASCVHGRRSDRRAWLRRGGGPGRRRHPGRARAGDARRATGSIRWAMRRAGWRRRRR